MQQNDSLAGGQAGMTLGTELWWVGVVGVTGGCCTCYALSARAPRHAEPPSKIFCSVLFCLLCLVRNIFKKNVSGLKRCPVRKNQSVSFD